MTQWAIGEIIRRRRLELELTQEELAERISIDGELLMQSDISRIETGLVKLPRPERLGQIAAALDLSLGDLLQYATGVNDSGQILVDSERLGSSDTAASEHNFFRPHQSFLGNVGQAVIATDADGTIILWNEAAERLYGWCATEAIGRHVSEVTVANAWQWQEEAAAIMNQLTNGRDWSGVFGVRKRDDSTFLARVTLSPVRDSRGEVVAIIGVSEAIEERCGVVSKADPPTSTRQAATERR